MSSICKCKSYSHFFSKNIGVYAVFNDQSFNDTLTNNIVVEQLGPRDPLIVGNWQIVQTQMLHIYGQYSIFRIKSCVSASP